MTEFDEILAAKDAEIAALRQHARNSTPIAASTGHILQPSPPAVHHRKGKGPPVDPFSGDDTLLRFEDWLPGLQRAADWYVYVD